MGLIARAATELRKEYPHIRYHLFSGNAADVTERLDNGLLDFGILVGEADMTRYDYLPLPVTDVWGVLMRKDSPLAGKNAVSQKDLSEIPLILSQQSLSSNELSGWYGGAFGESNIVATYNLIYNAALMVASGFGYAVTLDKLVNTTGNRDLCFRPLAPRLEARLSIVWKKHRGFSKATELFLQKLRCLIHPDD
ncbi:MAG: LysR family transcriptional regulator substrate-binding protein, partial [Oscillibacter sp.]|nr:LysR family transcriptional regulator substrate-binding protein [Oscillibacter sp.]